MWLTKLTWIFCAVPFINFYKKILLLFLIKYYITSIIISLIVLKLYFIIYIKLDYVISRAILIRSFIISKNLSDVKSEEIYKKMQKNVDREIGYIIEIRYNLIFN